MKALIIFLIRKRLHLRKGECFQFNNQKGNALYFFNRTAVMKITDTNCKPSNVSLNWLLNKHCRITKV